MKRVTRPQNNKKTKTSPTLESDRSVILNTLPRVLVFSDGGCNNITHSNAYGSFAVFKGSKEKWRACIQYPELRTSNEAEFRTLYEAFSYAIRLEEKQNKKYHWVFHMDSQLVYRCVIGTLGVSAQNLKPLCKAVRDIYLQHTNFEAVWVPRTQIVPVLGH